MKIVNNKVLIDKKIEIADRINYSLNIDAVYCADKIKAKTLAGEVLSKIFLIGNAGGFRIKGSIKSPKFIVIYTAGDDLYWRDELDNSLGVLLYYGDNRSPGKDLYDTKKGGNLILKNIFDLAASGNPEDKKKIPPIFVFKKYDDSRDMKFLGLAVPGMKGKPQCEWLTAVWGCSKTGDRFLNYRAYFTILDTKMGHTGEAGCNISLEWLTDIENDNAYGSSFAPIEWKKYVEGKTNYLPLTCKIEKYAKSKDEQLPQDKEELKMLKTLHDYFIQKDGGYSFEPFANDMVRKLDNSVVDIFTTRPYQDGGYDGIGQYKLFKQAQNEVLVEFYIQAKCYAIDNSVTVKDTARLISRIKDRQFGIMLTTSYVAKQAYQEILDDGHPVVMLTGKSIIDYLRSVEMIVDSTMLKDWLLRNY